MFYWSVIDTVFLFLSFTLQVKETSSDNFVSCSNVPLVSNLEECFRQHQTCHTRLRLILCPTILGESAPRPHHFNSHNKLGFITSCGIIMNFRHASFYYFNTLFACCLCLLCLICSNWSKTSLHTFDLWSKLVNADERVTKSVIARGERKLSRIYKLVKIERERVILL